MAGDIEYRLERVDLLPLEGGVAELHRLDTLTDYVGYLAMLSSLQFDDSVYGRDVGRLAGFSARSMYRELNAPQQDDPLRYNVKLTGGRVAAGANLGLQHDVPYIGYWVLPEYRRAGLATAVARSLTSEAHRQGFERVYANVRPGNATSLKTLHKVGFGVHKRSRQWWLLYHSLDDGSQLG